MMRSTGSSVSDQAQLPLFRALLGVQALATIVFGVVPLLAAGLFASITGYSGDDVLVYRLAGAATTGYLVAALLALAGGSRWAELRIPIVATLSFTAAATIGCAWSLVEGDRHWVVIVVLVAAAAFTGIALYWLRRDEGGPVEPGPQISSNWRIVIALATVSAAVFGLAPFVAQSAFASIAQLAGTDVWIFRMAGAACFGYAVAGVLELQAPGYRLIAIQNRAAITFNALGASAAWISVVSGGGGLLAPAVGVAATFFAVALAVLDRQASPG